MFCVIVELIAPITAATLASALLTRAAVFPRFSATAVLDIAWTLASAWAAREVMLGQIQGWIAVLSTPGDGTYFDILLPAGRYV